MILSYTRNKQLTVQDLDNSVISRTSIHDTFFEATVELEVKVPQLEVISAKGEIKSCFFKECRQAVPLLEKIVSLRIGPGITRSVKDLVGGPNGCDRLADLVFECFDAVILRYTADEERNMKETESLEEEIQQKVELLKRNPRLLGSCIAFAEDSPFVTKE